MFLRGAAIMALVGLIAPASAEELKPDEARRFVAGKLFSYTCFEGTTGAGRIHADWFGRGYHPDRRPGTGAPCHAALQYHPTQSRFHLRLGSRCSVPTLLQFGQDGRKELSRLAVRLRFCLLRFRPPQSAPDGRLGCARQAPAGARAAAAAFGRWSCVRLRIDRPATFDLQAGSVALTSLPPSIRRRFLASSAPA